MEERSLLVTVEAVGTMVWQHTKAIGDPRWLEPVSCAQVVDEDGHRYHVTAGICFRNGTSICEQMIGKRGRLGLFGWTPISFSLPILFGREAV